MQGGRGCTGQTLQEVHGRTLERLARLSDELSGDTAALQALVHRDRQVAGRGEEGGTAWSGAGSVRGWIRAGRGESGYSPWLTQGTGV